MSDQRLGRSWWPDDVDDVVKSGEVGPVCAERGESDGVGSALDVGGVLGDLMCQVVSIVGLVHGEQDDDVDES